MLFTYGSRTDTNLTGSAPSDSVQVKYSANNRLDRIVVQAKDTGNAWQDLRAYRLNSSYITCASGSCTSRPRLVLDSVDRLPSNLPNPTQADILHTYQFGYSTDTALYPDGKRPNSIHLVSADNGWGGKINYTYNLFTSSNSNGCSSHCKRWKVIRTVVHDGVANNFTTDYSYSTLVGVADSGEYLGYTSSTVTWYVANSTSVIHKREKQEQEAGELSQPGPNRGRPKLVEVRNAANTLLASTRSIWRSYWLANLNGVVTWDTANPKTQQIDNGVHHAVWTRLEVTDSWVDRAGKLTRYAYEAAEQNNLQYGNVTHVEEWSHLGEEADLSFSTWQTAANNYVNDTNPANDTTLKLLRKTVTLYVPNPTDHIVNKPVRILILEGATTCKSETRLIYDGNGLAYTAMPTQGLLTRQAAAINTCFSASSPITERTNDWLVTYFQYDPYGNQTQATTWGATSNQDDSLATVYDSTYKLFPSQQYKVQNSTFQENAVYYGVNEGGLTGGSGRWGQMKEHCAVNETCTRLQYDLFGRPLARWERVGKGGAWGGTATTTYGYQPPNTLDPNQKTLIVTEWRVPRCYGNFVRTHYNGLGQAVIEQRPAQHWSDVVEGCGVTGQGQEVDRYFAYDALGNQTTASVPKLMGRAGHATRMLDFTTATLTLYDALSRPVNITAPNGEVSYYTYKGRTNALWGKARPPDTYDKVLKRNDVDGLGFLRYIRTYTSSGVEDGVESLTHDATGNLTGVTHAAGAGSTSMTYDLLGLKKTMNDADLGSWSYDYDLQGNLTRQTDARGKTTCLYYERGLFRLAGKHFRTDTTCPTVAGYDPNGYPTLSNSASQNVTYLYDQNHNGVLSGTTMRSRGQLTQVRYTDGSYQKNLRYDQRSLLWEEAVSIGGAPTAYSTWHGYDEAFRPDTMIYPDGEWVYTSYNSMGLPNKLTSSWFGEIVDGTTSAGGIVNSVSYDEVGRLTAMRFPQGGNLWRSQLYYNWNTNNSNGGMLQAIQVGVANGNADKLGLTYTYDSFGNIASLAESHSAAPATTYNFVYDSQNRVTNAFGRGYTYDAAGRLTSYETATYLPDSTHKHAVATVNGLTRYTYDANGNMTTRNLAATQQQVLTWDHENHLEMISGGGLPTESYAYDPDGQRVKKTSNPSAGSGQAVTTWYPNGWFESSRDQSWIDDGLPPAPTIVVGAEDGWNWISSGPAPMSGSIAHASAINSGLHQHYFQNAPAGYQVTPGTGDGLYIYVYLDPANPPSEVMVQWNDGTGWEHRAYWGANIIPWGTDGTASRRYMGPLPNTGAWVRLEVPAALVGLENVTVSGMAYTLYGGRAFWDKTGISTNTKYYTFNGQPIAMRKNGVLTYLHADHLGSTVYTTDSAGNGTVRQGYLAYGNYRLGATLPTDRKFTGQKQDSSGLYYYNARYYDPQLGTFISPDTLVPDPGNLHAYNRYMYGLGNPLRYNDPSGHNPRSPCCITGPSLVPQILQLMADVATVVLEPAGEAVQVVTDHPMFGPSLGELQEMHSDLMETYVDPYLPEGVRSTLDSVSTMLNSPGVSDALLATIKVPPLGAAIGGYTDEVSLAKQLHRLRPARHAQSATTTAVISALDESNNTVYFVANNYGLSKAQQEAIQSMPNFIIVPTPKGNLQHPEMLILQYAGMNHPNYKLLRAGASWTICQECAPILQQQGVQVLNPR